MTGAEPEAVTGADEPLLNTIRAGLAKTPFRRLGVAVSGGGDSMALLHLLASCAADHGVMLEAATVDHGLRPEAAEEAGFVAQTCRGLGIRHEILRWEGWDGSGNLQAEARAARYRLLASWAKRRGLEAVALGHTRDDQAETFLMRLGREAGVDGLSAMDVNFSREGAQFWRPLLAQERAALRAFLSRHGQGWRDDPSNEDPRYDRVRARKALAVLAGLGIDARTLQGVARNLSSARVALKACTHETAGQIVRMQAGDVLIARTGFSAAPWEIRRRLLAAALLWVAGGSYAPRREALDELDQAITAARAHTLHGCLISIDGDHIRISREANAVKDLTAIPGALWDDRWRLTGPEPERFEIRALGEAVKDCPDRRETGLPRSSLMASPAVWEGANLVAAPLAGLINGWSAELDPPRGDFFSMILSH